MVKNTLVLFSKGLITKEKAIEKLGLHDYAELLVALGVMLICRYSLYLMKKLKNRQI
jgi:hypothetical protein